MGGIFSGFKKTIHLHNRRLHVLKKVAEGGFSSVFQVRDRGTKEVFALKVILVNEEEQEAEVNAEIANFKLVNHPNVLKLVDAAIVPSKKAKLHRQAVLLMPFFSVLRLSLSSLSLGLL